MTTSFPKAPLRQAFVERVTADPEWSFKVLSSDEPLPDDPCLAYAVLEGQEANLERYFRIAGFREGDWREYQSFDVVEGRSRPFGAFVWTTSNTSEPIKAFYRAFKSSSGLYVIGNELNPAVRFRSAKDPSVWQAGEQKKGTKDDDILSRRLLFIDIDAVRPDGISSTFEEMKAAQEVAVEIYDCLADYLGTEAPLGLGHSGNGGTVLVALDAPNDEETRKLFQSILSLLGRMFNTRPGVHVDEKVFNAHRLMPLFGTRKTKGSNSAERPHRLTSLWMPDIAFRRVAVDELRIIENGLTKIAPPEEVKARPSAPAGAKPAYRKDFDNVGKKHPLEHFVQVKEVPIADVMERLGLKTGDAIKCPGCGTEEARSRGGSVAILEEFNRFKCSHNRCASKGREGSRSAIDLVAESKNCSENEAIDWLAEQFRITLTEVSFNRSEGKAYDEILKFIEEIPKDTGPLELEPKIKSIAEMTASLPEMQAASVAEKLKTRFEKLGKRVVGRIFEGARSLRIKADRPRNSGGGGKSQPKQKDNSELITNLTRRVLECACLAIIAAPADMIEITLRKQTEVVSSVIAGTNNIIPDLYAFGALRDAAQKCTDPMSLDSILSTLSTAFDEGGKTPKPPPGLSVFPDKLDRGDEVELAIKLIELLKELGPIVFDEGALYEYQPHSGLWVEIEKSVLSQYLQQFAGIIVGDDEEARPLYVSNRQVKGAIALAYDRAFQRGFFEKAPVGIGFANGFVLVSAEGIELKPHSPDRRARSGLRLAYRPNAPRPMWEDFLHKAFFTDTDAKEKIQFLQEFMGACFLGIATTYQLATVLTGSGANGKSVFIQCVSAQFPHNAIAAIAPQEWTQEYRRAMLAGKRLNALSELPEQDILQSESFKAFISGDQMTGRHIRQDPFLFKPIAGHLFAANQLPGTTDFTDGFWRRLALISFNQVFKGHDADTELPDKLIAAESQGIVSWMLDGAQNLLGRKNYVIPKSSVEAKDEWRQAADSVSTFLLEMTKSEPNGNGQPATTPASTLYVEYRSWALRSGFMPVSIKKFARRMADLGKPSIKETNSNTYPVSIVDTVGAPAKFVPGGFNKTHFRSN